MEIRELTHAPRYLDLSSSLVQFRKGPNIERRKFPPAKKSSFPDVGWCRCSVASRRRGVAPVTNVSFPGEARFAEKLWREFFSDPSRWWDCREKVNARYPDFKHKKAQKALWLNYKFNPPWVEAQLAAMQPGTVQPDIFSWNRRLARCNKAGDFEKTLEIFYQMPSEGMDPNTHTFVQVIHACTNLGALERGRQIHRQIIQNGCASDAYVSSCLVDMYVKCGSIDDAWTVFNQMPKHNAVAWGAMTLGLVKCGQGHKALELSRQMKLEGVEPDSVTFVAMLNACANLMALEEGRLVHAQIIRKGCESDVFVGNSLIDMYAKCGNIEDARSVFNGMPTRNVISWTAMILGYVKCGEGEEALEVYRLMQVEGVEPNPITYVGVLNACATVGTLENGRLVHKRIIESGCESDVFVGNSLVDMYAKCGSIEDACMVFQNMEARNVVTWSAMILGYVKCGKGKKALEIYQWMQREGVEPDSVTFVGVLNACASLGALEEGRVLHEKITERGYEFDIFVGSSLLDMYVKCGSTEDAWRVFNKMPTHSVVSWNAMILGYVKCGQGQKALKLSRQMQEEGVQPDPVTFVGLLRACTNGGALEDGRHLHEQIRERGCEAEVFVGSSLVVMYASFGKIEDAWRVFNKMPTRDVIAWSAMILGYVKCGYGHRALDLYEQMQLEGLTPDPAIFVGVLNACAGIGALEKGRLIHKQVIQSECESDITVAGSLVDMYVKCGSIDEARRLFKKMPYRNVVASSAMILGYVKSGQGQKALEISRLMQLEGKEPTEVNILKRLNACASLGTLEEGRRVHEQIIQIGCESNVSVGSSLVDMYAKCGSIENAWREFNKMRTHNLMSWNALLEGYAMHGHTKQALELFKRMNLEGVEMDASTFICVLSACSHAGLVNEGLSYFEVMTSMYSISATLEHHTCIVRLLGQAGLLHEASDMINTMSWEPNVVVWLTLLNACRVHGNVKMGEYVAKQVLELDPKNSLVYALLSNIYSCAGKWNDGAQLKQQRLDNNVKMVLECSWTEVNAKVHSFTIDDRTHPQIVKIREELNELHGLIKEAGYVPETRFAFYEVPEEEKVYHLCHHSERLAIAFGLINISPGIPVRIFTNIRVCDDCHTATKLIARIIGKPIIIRDANRFHRFEDGFCSCRDYW